MEDKKTNVGKKTNGLLKVNISAGEDKIKYYEWNDNNCIFEISNDNNANEPIDFNKIENDASNGEFEFLEDEDKYHVEDEECVFNQGKIIVKSLIDYGKREVLSGVKINLYKINGLSPVLIKSDFTDKRGKVIFKNIQDGNYRVIEIVDKRYFEKPKYVNWNEITINRRNREKKIVIVKKLNHVKINLSFTYV